MIICLKNKTINYLKNKTHNYASLRTANNVFFNKLAIVIGPTPPGTGDIKAHFGATSSNFTSPINRKPDFLVASSIQ